jgi:hypothetical protein
VSITVEPGRHGVVSAFVSLTGPAPESLSVTAALPGADLGPIAVPLTPDGPDHYSASGVLLPHAGTWQFVVIVTTSEFDSPTTQIDIPLA